MMIGYLAGIVVIPRYLSLNKTPFIIHAGWTFSLPFRILVLTRPIFLFFSVALLGCANACVMAAIWPQALKGFR